MVGLEVTTAAAAASDCLVTAMLEKWLLQWTLGGIMNLDSRVKMMAAERQRVAMWLPSLVRQGHLNVRQ